MLAEPRSKPSVAGRRRRRGQFDVNELGTVGLLLIKCAI
ncbi:MAG: hypothetical protein K0Q71_6039, partial [Thermomicrobiales bacterium]|nr:hypothetical protein [Thermomicrobiales bacterium]